MSRELFSRNPDLKRLRAEGYSVTIIGGFLVMRDVPYLDQNRQVRTATVISSLTMAGDDTQQPDTHVVFFDGDEPYRADGSAMTNIIADRDHKDLGSGLKANFTFSSKPDTGYPDYYEKMSTYATILSGPAAVVDPNATPRVYKDPEPEDESPFLYTETASDRAGIGALTDRLRKEKVAIIGLGGTGGYILDLVAKTPVQEIRLIDEDDFLQHNAFRAPGAASIEQLREKPKKVDYFREVYSRMHNGIVAHAAKIGAETLHLLEGITFAFLSMDAGDQKILVVKKLEELGIPFIDVGMGLELTDGNLSGILRVTASTPEKRDHVHAGRISFAVSAEKDLYSSNIQVADLNAMNAVLAVIKWKKLLKFYFDLEQEHHSTFTIDGNMLLNEDKS